ncbi:hypothetical protein Tco_0093652 [Tanacetum coccineum]
MSFFKAFAASANVPSIYLQQFWNTLTQEAKTRLYTFQLDEQWFTLNSDLLHDALEITPVDLTNLFMSPPAGEKVLDFMNKLEFIQGIQVFFAHRDSNKDPSKKPTPHVIPYCRFTKLIIYYLGSKYNIHKRPESPRHVMGDDFLLGNLKFVPKEMAARKVQAKVGGKKKTALKADKPVEHEPEPEPQGKGKEYDIERAIQMSLESFQATSQAPVGGKGKAIATDELAAQSLLDLHKPKKTSTTDQYIFQRRIPVTEEASTGPSAQPEDDTSANIVRDTPSPTDAETGAKTDKTNSEGDTEILNIGEEQGEDVTNQVNLEDETVEIDEGQAGSDPRKTPESRPPPERVLMEEDQAGPDPGQRHVALARPDPEPMHDDFVATIYLQVHESLKHPDEEHAQVENPLSSTGTLSSMKNLDPFTFDDQFFNDKPTEKGPDKANIETEVESMVTVLIHQASSFVPPLSTPVIDLTPPKPVSHTIQTPIFTTTTMTTTTTLPLPPLLQQQSSSDLDLASRISTLEQVCANFKKRHKLQDNIVQGLSFRVFTLELRDLPHMIDETVLEAVKEAVHVALQAPIRNRFRELPKADMKEILHQRMFKSGTYKSLPKHVALYEALEASMERANRDEFLVKKDKSQKRHRDDQDPPPPPPDSDLSKKKRHDSGTSGFKQPPAPQYSVWKTSDTREAPSISSMQSMLNRKSYCQSKIEVLPWI